MSGGFMDVVRIAICGWHTTLRLCLIIVVTTTVTLYFYLMGLPILPGLLR